MESEKKAATRNVILFMNKFDQFFSVGYIIVVDMDSNFSLFIIIVQSNDVHPFIFNNAVLHTAHTHTSSWIWTQIVFQFISMFHSFHGSYCIHIFRCSHNSFGWNTSKNQSVWLEIIQWGKKSLLNIEEYTRRLWWRWLHSNDNTPSKLTWESERKNFHSPYQVIAERIVGIEFLKRNCLQFEEFDK